MIKTSFISSEPRRFSTSHAEVEINQNNNKDEIFHKEQEKLDNGTDEPMSWLRSNFFLADKRVLFGTWNGVFTSIILNIFGVLIYLRAGWMVAEAGTIQAMLVVVISFGISFITISSSIALSEKCKLNHEANIRGGIFYLLSSVLGIKVAVCVGLFYCFGQAVNLSLTLTAFGESVCYLFELTDEQNLVLSNFISRFVAVITLLFILGINVAGVKWILRLQIILLIILLVSFVDLIVGSFSNLDPDNGIVGYSTPNFIANLYSSYSSDENIFTVYGVFFPATTGIFMGINMAYELKNPGLSIPIGTYGGIFSCFLLYSCYILIFGSVVLRSFLYTDFFIGEKISYTGYLFLIGFYVCSISSSVGSFYAPSRLIQTMAKQELFPKLFDILKNENGKNKLPIPAILLVSTITFVFTIVGQINILAPIVSMPYMLTYAAVNYAYFAFKSCEDRELAKRDKQIALNEFQKRPTAAHSPDSEEDNDVPPPLSVKSKKRLSEKDILLPDLVLSSSRSKRTNYGGVSFSRESNTEKQDESQSCDHEEVKIDFRDLQTAQVDDTYKFSNVSNKWIAILGAIGAIVSMILVNYIYAIISFIVCYLIFLQLRFSKPGLPKGSSHLNLDKHIIDYFYRLVNTKSENAILNRVKSCLRRRKPAKNENEFMVVIKPSVANITLETRKSQISVENVDYSGRKPYHHYDNYQSQSMND